MSRALGRAVTSPTVFVLAVLLLAVGTVGGTVASFTGETQHQASTFAGGWLDAATGLAAPTPSGYGAVLTWAHGTHALTGQDLYYTDEGTTSSCAGAAYSTLASAGLSATLNTVTDSRGSAADGHYLCYQIRSTHGSWYTGANFGIVQVGLVPTGLSTGNTGNHQLDSGDTIAITFNQAVGYSGGAFNVCAFSATGTILLGDATSGCGSSADTPVVGAVSGLTIGADRVYAGSTVTVSGSQLTVTLGSAGTGASGRTTVTGTGTFTGGGSPTSTSGGAVACTITGCKPTTTFSFS
jgi:hypothetical protein